MGSHFIVPAAGQQFAPVVRRVVQIGRSVGENVRIDKSNPSPVLVVGDKTIARWQQLNAERLAADAKTKADLADRRAEATAAASEPAPEPEPEPEPAAEAAPAAADDTDGAEESAPVKKTATARKRKTSK